MTTLTLFTTRFTLMGGSAVIGFIGEGGRPVAERIARVAENEGITSAASSTIACVITTCSMRRLDIPREG